MDKHESVRIKLSLECADGLSQQWRLSFEVQPHVLSFGFDPFNLVRVEEKDSPSRFEPEEVPIRGPSLLSFGRQSRFDLGQCFVEPLTGERLQQKIDGMNIKRRLCVVIIPRYEDHQRAQLFFDLLEH